MQAKKPKDAELNALHNGETKMLKTVDSDPPKSKFTISKIDI